MRQTDRQTAKRLAAIFLCLVMAVSMLSVPAFAAPPSSGNRVEIEAEGYTLSYPEIGILDLYGILGPTGYEIDYDAFELDGDELDADKIVNLTITSGAKKPGGFNTKNQFIYARSEDSGDITISVRVEVTPAPSRKVVTFELTIGEIQNSTIGNIEYKSNELLTMDPYGLTAGSITLAPSDFIIEVNGEETDLNDFITDYTDGEHARGSISVSMAHIATDNHFRAPSVSGEEYTFIPHANDTTTTNNTNGVEASVRVKVAFADGDSTAVNNVNVQSDPIKVATIYNPTVRAEGTTKEITLQQGVLDEKEVDLGPTHSDNKNWQEDFPDFKLFYTIDGTEHEVADPSSLDLRFGQLRVWENDEIRHLERENDSLEITVASEECVDLWYSTGSEPSLQKIIANAETGDIEIIVQNVVLKAVGGGRDLILTDKVSSSTQVSPIQFTYKVTLIPTYTVTFDSNGGSAVAEMRNSGSATITLPTSTRSGYTFTGWKDAQGSTHAAGLYTPTGDVTLTAQWQAVSTNTGTPPTPPANPQMPVGTEEPVAQQRPFDDVLVSDWYDENVTYVWENDLMVGTAHRTFSPSMNTSRAMIVTILHRFAGEPAAAGTVFADVAAGTWYSEAVAWGAENEIILGYGDGSFGPNDNVTRQDLAVILARFIERYSLELPLEREAPSFADADSTADYAQDAVTLLYRIGVINGKDNNRFDPTGLATRAEVAAMISRFVQLIAE